MHIYASCLWKSRELPPWRNFFEMMSVVVFKAACLIPRIESAGDVRDRDHEN